MVEKKITIEGMHCSGCSRRVEAVLNSIQGAKATVNLEKGYATVISENTLSDSVLKNAVEELGFDVMAIN